MSMYELQKANVGFSALFLSTKSVCFEHILANFSLAHKASIALSGSAPLISLMTSIYSSLSSGGNESKNVLNLMI